MSSVSIKPTVKKALSTADYMAIICLAIFVLLPFHAFVTTWAGASFGHIDAFRIWKELLIFGLALASIFLLINDKPLTTKLFHSKLFQSIGLYVFISLLRTFFGYQTNTLNIEQILYGLIAGLRFLTFFTITWIVANKSHCLEKYWLAAVITPATIVVIFGLLQQTVLDRNFLSHFGYGDKTIPAFQSIDSKPEYVRVQSFLRGANPLGAYLSFIVIVIIDCWHRVKTNRIGLSFLLMASLIVLFFTFSRSAWAGIVVSFVAWTLLESKNPKTSRRIILMGSAGLIIGLSVIYGLRNNNYVQNTFFHTDESSQSIQSSNAARTSAMGNGVRDVINNPLGQGLGSAGPASARGEKPKIAENYYIQIAQETGVFGLIIFISIITLVVKDLYKKRDQDLPRIMLASLSGLIFINFVSHAWVDDTLSLLWWGLAGIAVAQSVTIKGNRHGKQTKSEETS